MNLPEERGGGGQLYHLNWSKNTYTYLICVSVSLLNLKKIDIIYVPTFVVSIPSHEFFRDDTWFDNPRKSSDNIHIETFWIFYGNNVFTSQSLSSICHVPVTQWFFKLIILDFSIMIGERQSCVKKHWLYIFFSKTVHHLLMCIKHRHCIFPRHKFTQEIIEAIT